MAKPEDMSISLIIPTLDPIAFDQPFRLMIAALRTRFPRLEVIVIDSASEATRISSHQKLADQFISIPRDSFNHGNTRTLAASKATGDFLVFMTQDAIMTSPDSLAALVRPLLENPSVAVSYGRQLPRATATPLERVARELNYPTTPLLKTLDPKEGVIQLKTFFSSNVFACYRRSTFWEVGGFPKDVILNEDMLINAQLLARGHACAYVPEATVIHSHHYTVTQQFQRYFDIGVSLRESTLDLTRIQGSGDGRRFVRAMFLKLLLGGHFFSCLQAIADLGARWFGYQLGINHRRLPASLKPHLSMHSFFWRKKINATEITPLDAPSGP